MEAGATETHFLTGYLCNGTKMEHLPYEWKFVSCKLE